MIADAEKKMQPTTVEFRRSWALPLETEESQVSRNDSRDESLSAVTCLIILASKQKQAVLVFPVSEASTLTLSSDSSSPTASQREKNVPSPNVMAIVKLLDLFIKKF